MEVIHQIQFGKDEPIELGTNLELDNLIVKQSSEWELRNYIITKLAEKIQAQAAEIKQLQPIHACWKESGTIWEGVDEYYVWRCSNCTIPNYRKTKYCPSCGAIMDKEQEEWKE
jgi:NADH pyrophosphatase NudC (nudix superfamily)